MSKSRHDAQSLEFSLPNAGPGPDQFDATDLRSASGIAFVVLLRNHYCPLSRRKVRELGDRIEEFRDLDVPVVAVLPDTTDRAAVWDRRYGVSFPLLADPDETADTDEDGHPTEFDVFGSVQNRLTRTPGVAVVETHDGSPTVAEVHGGATPQECPSVDDLLDIAREKGTDLTKRAAV